MKVYDLVLLHGTSPCPDIGSHEDNSDEPSRGFQDSHTVLLDGAYGGEHADPRDEVLADKLVQRHHGQAGALSDLVLAHMEDLGMVWGCQGGVI